MNLRKHLAGMTLFLIIFGSTVFIFNYLTAPIGPTAVLHPPTLPLRPATPVELSYEVSYVSLDFINRKSYTTLTLRREAAERLPVRLWVRTYFYVPGDAHRRVWSGEAVELRGPFTDSDRIEVTSVASCEWCASSIAPRAGYYARVIVSARSIEDTYLPAFEINREITTAAPVVVQAERKPGR